MFSIFKPLKYSFFTRIPLEMCVEILGTEVDRPHVSFTGGFRGDKEVLGYIYENGFELFKKRKYRQSVTPIWKGKFISVPQGTIIEVSISLSAFGILAAAFMYFSLMLILLGIFLFNMIDMINGKSSQYVYLHLAICLGIMLLLTIGIGFVKIVSSKEENFFVNFFKQQFKAKKNNS